MKLRVLLADDEKMARKRLRRLLETLGCEIVAECSSGADAMGQLDPERIDVAFLDIDMPEITGLEVSEIAAVRGVPVVFVTAHEQHAVEAFARGAAHYLLKPVDAARVEQALARVRPVQRSAARLALPVGNDMVLVDPTAISHALYDGHLVTLWADGKDYVLSESLSELEARLNPTTFVRVHRRALVNLEKVERLNTLSSGSTVAIVGGVLSGWIAATVTLPCMPIPCMPIPIPCPRRCPWPCPHR